MQESDEKLNDAHRDHGGGIDAARAIYGGTRGSWADLSTGINPLPYVFGEIPSETWTTLPDRDATERLVSAARHFWNVPNEVDVLATSGLSCAIAQIPTLAEPGRVAIPQPTYNEHAAAFHTYGWEVNVGGDTDAQVLVHPNNPDGQLWSAKNLPQTSPYLTVIDESFCDCCPSKSLIDQASRPGTLILKSFGKFWGLAGLRLGFVIGDPVFVSRLRESLGPWPVSGPALSIGAAALADSKWADGTRVRLASDASRLDEMMRAAGANIVGGTSLFRLYDVEDASSWQSKLGRHRIWSRIFPYNKGWLRLGIPHPLHWERLKTALK